MTKKVPIESFISYVFLGGTFNLHLVVGEGGYINCIGPPQYRRGHTNSLYNRAYCKCKMYETKMLYKLHKVKI